MNDLRWNKCLDELKQCLFCYGHEIHGDEIDSTLLTTDEKEWRQVVCNYCGAGGEMDLELSVAIKAWNTRPIEDALNKSIAKLDLENAVLRKEIEVERRAMSDEMKPCPFCGKDPQIQTIDEGYHQVYCINHTATIETESFGEWNNRPLEDALKERIAELEKDNRSVKHALDVWHDSYIELEKQFYAMKKQIGE